MESKFKIRLGDYMVQHNPKPIPFREFDWDWWHVDYDGPPDKRCGAGANVKDCIKQAKEVEEEAHEAQREDQ